MSLPLVRPRYGLDAYRPSPRRGAARRAAVALLTGVVTFIALQLLAAVVLEVRYPGAIDPDYAARLRRVRWGRAADPAQTRTVIMFGSSRTCYGLQAQALDTPLTRQLGRPVSVVNFGYTGGGALRNLVTWRQLRRDGIRPDLLLIEVIPTHLNDTAPPHEMREEGMPAERIRWLDLPLLDRYRAGTRPRLWRDVALAEMTTLYSRRAGILNALVPDLVCRIDAQGKPLVERLSPAPFPAVLPQEARYQARESARREYESPLAYYRPGGRGCDALTELLRACRAEGVPTALVLMPEGPAFRSWYPPETRRRVQAWLDELSRQEQVPVIDAREWIDEDDFLDSHHLLSSGAAKFTERLGRDWLLPMLRRLPAD